MSRIKSNRYNPVKLIQPVGFALMLMYFILARMPWAIVLLWTGAVFTIAGAFSEIWIFIKTPTARRTQVLWVFVFGIITKLLLIGAIVMRIYDTSYSLFILLGCIVMAMIWLVLSQLIKPQKEMNSEILDAD